MTTKSVREIQANLDKVVESLGTDKAVVFLETVLRLLRESVDNLLQSVAAKNVTLCKQYAHKLKGSSSLYGSKVLVELLVQVETAPEVVMNDTGRYDALVSEFELVMQQIKVKILEMQSETYG